MRNSAKRMLILGLLTWCVLGCRDRPAFDEDKTVAVDAPPLEVDDARQALLAMLTKENLKDTEDRLSRGGDLQSEMALLTNSTRTLEVRGG